MSVDDDINGKWLAYVFKFDKLNSSASRDFEVQTPIGPLDLTLELYLREGNIYGKVHLKQESNATRKEMICVSLFFKRNGKIDDEIQDWFSPAEGSNPFLLDDEIELFKNRDYQHIFIYCKALRVADDEGECNRGIDHGKLVCYLTLKIVYKDDEGECSRGIDHGKLLTSGLLSDFTISAEGQLFKCHKIILASRSTVFESMLTIDMKESVENKEGWPFFDIYSKVGIFRVV